jgi:hypothetical protein
MDWANEIANALVLHFDGHAALWTVTGNIELRDPDRADVEISLFFAINGVIFAKLLPKDRDVRILGLPNRWALAIGLSLVSVGVELLLHADGVFHWYYWWWNVATFPVIVVFGYLTFYVVAFWVHDMASRARQIRVVGTLAGTGPRWPGSSSARCSAGSERPRSGRIHTFIGRWLREAGENPARTRHCDRGCHTVARHMACGH